MQEIGRVLEIVRYPIKSMAGVSLDSAELGWHGIVGDRRFAFRRVGDTGGFPWLSASRLPEMVLFQPVGEIEKTGESLPTHIRFPDGSLHEIGSDELNCRFSERLGSDVELTHLRTGVFDDAAVSLIAAGTIEAIGESAGLELDRSRFRANIVIEAASQEPFVEDRWVGMTLVFGDGSAGSRPALAVTHRDIRCVMVNIDPVTAEMDPRVMKAVAKLNDANAGVYATVVRCGTIHVGDPVFALPAAQ